jgi:tol-pal system protein YbgF
VLSAERRVRSGERARFAALVAFAWALLAPLPSAEAALFDDDVARKQIAEERRRVDALSEQQAQLAERLAKVEEALKHQPVLALVSQIEALREEMRQLRGQIEVVSNNIEMASKRQRDMYVDLDTRLRRLEQPGATGAPAPGAAGGAPGQTASGGAGEDARIYEAAQNQRRIGNYQAAIVAFQGFLAQFPQSPLAPRAQYWIGDSYFNLRDFKNAIANQQKLISTYPDSASVPDAMLNIASCQLELGDAASARRSMDTLVARYPSTEAAEKARRRLATLR